MSDIAQCPLKKLVLTANRTINDAFLKTLASECPDLEQLDLLGSKDITCHGLDAMLVGCTKLVFLDISFCRGILEGHARMLQGLYPKVTFKQSMTSRR